MRTVDSAVLRSGGGMRQIRRLFTMSAHVQITSISDPNLVCRRHSNCVKFVSFDPGNVASACILDGLELNVIVLCLKASS